MLVLGARPFGVPMKMMLGRGDFLGLAVFGVDAKYARLLMIEPHEGLMSLQGTP